MTCEADRLFPKIYDEFASALIGEIRQQRSDELQRYLERVADRWIARDAPRIDGLHGCDRIEGATRVLADRGFMPVLERMGDGYRLHEHNCPLTRLTAEYPEVCNMVHRWLEALFGNRLNRVQCLRLGDPFSAYEMTAGTAGSEKMKESPQ